MALKKLKDPKTPAPAALFPIDGKGISPYHYNHLLDIFVDPRRFFSPTAALGRPLNLLIALWLLGMTSILYVVVGDTLLVTTQNGAESKLPPELLQSWSTLWTVLFLGGLVVGVLLWLVGGWWFRERVLLSGARRPDFRLSRIVFVYASLVRSLPPLVLLTVWTLRYPNYAAVSAQDIFIAATLSVVFSCGELISAYVGVNTLFSIDRWRGRLWFVLAPATWYAVSLGTDFFGL